MQKDAKIYHILVVEDNPGDYLLVEDYLDELLVTPTLIKAESFKEAHEILTDRQVAIDVILLDLSLPDRRGEALIRDVKAVSGNAPLIILTGYTDENFAIKSLSIGATDYLLKDELNATALYKSIVYSIERCKILGNLKDSEQRYADLFHFSPQPMWVYDVETLRFLDVNEAAILSYGYSYQEFLSMSIRDIRPKEDIPLLQQTLMRPSKQEEVFFRGEFRHLKKNGEIIYVDLRSSSIVYNSRAAKIILSNDVTANKIHLTAIEQQNEKLKEIAWLQSHVVRAPLARMMGLTHLLIDDELPEPEYREYLNEILNSAHELDTIIKDIVHKAQGINFNIDKNE